MTTSPHSFEREPARRIFSAELREARVQYKTGDDDKSPTYVLMPTGIHANRVFIVGSITEKQRRGDQNAFYTARIADPTGVFFVSAGNYQPDAMQQLAKLEPPAFVAVVGKPNVYHSPDGAVRVSVRVESITPVDAETRTLWVLDTARKTLDRLDAFGTTEESRRAEEEYNTNTNVYRKIVYDALSQLQL